jgi:predicted Na+-dependent transporter
MFYVVLSGLFLGLLFPLTRTAFLSTVVTTLFAYMTFVTSLEISLKEFIKILGKPWKPLWMLCLLHLIAPVVAWLVGSLFYPDDYLMRLGFLISASLPIAVTSIIWTSIAGGNVAVSLVTVTLDTLIVPFFLPIFFALTVGQTLQINYQQMIWQLMLMVTLPSLLGMILHDLTSGGLDNFSNSFGGFSSKVGIIVVIMINASIVAPFIQWGLPLLKMLMVILFLVASGYLLGFLGTFALKDNSREMKATMTFNVGMRNISFGAVLAISYFPSAVAVPIILATLYQQPIAALIGSLLNRTRFEVPYKNGT